MSALEKIRGNPARYLLPNAMTVARPVLGYQALQAAREGNWKKARNRSILAWATDLDGMAARFLHATSKTGAVLDPVADSIWRFEMVAALAPHFNPVLGAISLACELENLLINARIQKSPTNAVIPMLAKRGFVLQGVGVELFLEGMVRDDERLKRRGELTVATASQIRRHSYRKLERDLQKVA